jgi:hypothetical protein
LDAALEVGVGGGNEGSVVIDPTTDPEADAIAIPGKGALEPKSDPLIDSEADAVVVSGGGVGNNQGFFVRAAVAFGIALLISLRRPPRAWSCKFRMNVRRMLMSPGFLRDKSSISSI